MFQWERRGLEEEDTVYCNNDFVSININSRIFLHQLTVTAPVIKCPAFMET